MKKYQIIYADPAWSYKAKNPTCKIEKQPKTCSVEYYYQTLSLNEIKNLPIRNIMDENAVLFLWATTPLLPEALETMSAWGFKYKTMLTWEKTNKDCMGYWFRVCTEHLLVGVRGNVKCFRSMQRTLYQEQRQKHSKKPDFFRNLISDVAHGNKIELFARQKTEGWDAIGYDIDGKDIRKTLEGLKI